MDLSLIICTRNRSEGLAEVLGFCEKIKTDHAWELLIIDSSSDGRTQEIVQGWQTRIKNIRYIFEKKLGLAAARERAWREAKGRIITYIDDDCLPEPALINHYVELFRAHPDVGYMGGRSILWDESDIKVGVKYEEAPAEIPAYSFIPAGTVSGANMAFRKDVLDIIGPSDIGWEIEGPPFGRDDIDMAACASWKGYKGLFHPAPLVYHHHGRKEEDRAEILHRYDQGRGAYYMKFLLRPESRRIYWQAWVASARRDFFENHHDHNTLTEIRSGLRYLFREWLIRFKGLAV